MLGRIIEKVRQSIHDENDLEQWIQSVFSLVESRRAMPSIKLDVHKEG